jgi:hypothetical protein
MKKENNGAATLEETQTGLEVSQPKENGVAVRDPSKNMGLQSVDLNGGDLPDLEDATTIPVDLTANYWTPQRAGESKRVFFDSVRMRPVLDQQTGEILELMCAFFFEKTEGDIKTISNGSKRLVGIFEGGQFERGTPFLITYLGKKKNATNGFQSDSWSVHPLQIKGK